MRIADSGLAELEQHVDTLIVIPNQNLFKLADAGTTFADAFEVMHTWQLRNVLSAGVVQMADSVLHQGVRSITDLMVSDARHGPDSLLWTPSVSDGVVSDIHLVCDLYR